MNTKYLFQTIRFSVLVFLTATSLSLITCSDRTDDSVTKDAHTQHDDSGEMDGHSEVPIVALSDEAMKEFGVEIRAASAGTIPIHRKLTGEIVVEPDRLAHIFPRFPGIVKDVRKRIGDRVKAGEVLAVIESNESLATYEVKSLIAGTVGDMHLSLGEVVADDSHAFTITDLSSVWANFSVYQKDLPYIKLGQRVTISAGPDAPQTTGTISYVSPIVDEETRTATARVVLPNPTGEWRPGLFVTGLVQIDAINAEVVVPKTALETYESQTVVFVQTDEGFRPQPVHVGRSNDATVEIISGLNPGQSYVAKNGFTLKAELEKATFSGGHAH